MAEHWGPIVNPGGSTTPSGPAGGDLTGNYPNPTVASISAASGIEVTNSIGVGITPSGNVGWISIAGGGYLYSNNYFSIDAHISGGIINLQSHGNNIALIKSTGLEIVIGSQTATAATVSNPSVSSGSAFTPNANVDTMLYVPIVATTTGTVTITMGPTTGAENTIVPSSNLVALSEPTYTFRVPNGWKVVITVTGTTVTIGTVTAVVC